MAVHDQAIGRSGQRPHGAVPEPEELTDGIPETREQGSRNWDRLIPVRDQVLKSLETARNDKFIGASLEAKVRVAADDDTYRLLEQYADELPAFFIVSQVALSNANDFLEVARRARRGHQVRALLEVHDGRG